MNAQNAKEFLPLIQAMAEGKIIQYQIGHGLWHYVEWIDTIEGYPSDYRIKPEPQTFDVWLNERTKRVVVVEDGDCDKDEIFFEWKRITVQEVVK